MSPYMMKERDILVASRKGYCYLCYFLIDSNSIQINNHLVLKQTLENLAKFLRRIDSVKAEQNRSKLSRKA